MHEELKQGTVIAVHGLGFRVLGFGFRVLGLGFRVFEALRVHGRRESREHAMEFHHEPKEIGDSQTLRLHVAI